MRHTHGEYCIGERLPSPPLRSYPPPAKVREQDRKSSRGTGTSDGTIKTKRYVAIVGIRLPRVVNRPLSAIDVRFFIFFFPLFFTANIKTDDVRDESPVRPRLGFTSLSIPHSLPLSLSLIRSFSPMQKYWRKKKKK